MGIGGFVLNLVPGYRRRVERERERRLTILPGMARISGRVFDALTKETVANAEVSIHADDWRRASTTTDRFGAYAFPNIAEGTYDLKAKGGPGYVGRDCGARRTVHIEVGQVLSNIDLQVTRGCSVVGRVVYEDGTPAACAEIETAPRLVFWKSFLSEKDGSFVIEGFPPDKRCISWPASAGSRVV